MKIYGFPISPFVRKVLVAALEKGLEVETVPSNPMQPDEDFLACSPYRKIPAIDDGGFKLADSSAIAHYLEAKYPEPALLPEDAQARGKAVWFDEVGDTIVMAAGGPMMFNRFLRAKILGEEPDHAAADASEQAVAERLPTSRRYSATTAGSTASSRSAISPSPRSSSRSTMPTGRSTPLRTRRSPAGTDESAPDPRGSRRPRSKPPCGPPRRAASRLSAGARRGRRTARPAPCRRT